MRPIGSLRSIGLLVSTLALMIFFSTTVDAQWRLDGGDRLRNFRIDSRLSASASAQPTELSLEEIRSKVPRGLSLWIVDLRQESHGFANGIPISWYEEHNAANAALEPSEIERDERARLQSLLGRKEKFEPLGRADKLEFKPLRKKVRSVETEREMISRLGFNYARFTAADMVAPDDAVVEEFVRFVRRLPDDAWLHFHCQAGQGRTTTFMVIYDLIKHPDRSLEESVKRQVELGGSDLLSISSGDDWYAQRHNERAAWLKNFYRRLRSIET